MGLWIDILPCLTGIHHCSSNCIQFSIHIILLKRFKRFFYWLTFINRMNSLVTRIDQLIEKQSLLKHKFYVMWNEGTLTLESLSGYSKEYFQLVKAVPGFVNMIKENTPHGKDAIAENQKEESEHIVPWAKFANSLGVSARELDEYAGLDKTREAVSNLSKLMTTFEGG